MIETGDIIFVKGSGLISKIIRFFDEGQFSHVAVAISKTHILEAQYLKKVEITPFYYGQKEVEIVKLNLNEEQKRKVINTGLQLTGIWYDYKQLLWYVLQKFKNLEGRNLFNNPNNLICSELVCQVLLAVGYIHPSEKVADLTPNQLYNYLKNICETRGNCSFNSL